MHGLLRNVLDESLTVLSLQLCRSLYNFSPKFDFTTGVAVTHFSNGNTKFPNAGLNSIGLKVGLVYNINRKEECFAKPLYQSPVPKFPRHISYDLVLLYYFVFYYLCLL